MMVIRDAQFEALKHAEIQKFVEHLLIQIREDYPEEYGSMGEDSARDFIDSGIKKADGFQITTRRQVRKFIDIMLYCGIDFTETEQYAWTREILEGSDTADSKIDSIVERLLNS